MIFTKKRNDKIILTHNSGFFSCCSVRLHMIIHYFNLYKQLPYIIDSSQSFEWYKTGHSKDDITFHYFEDYNKIDQSIIYQTPIKYNFNYQFINYSKIDYEKILPFIQKYFSPSLEIKKNIEFLEKKYNMNYDNICVLFYRGNDKLAETTWGGFTNAHFSDYEDYIKYGKEIMEKNPNIIFFIQSDETQFIETMLHTFPTNSFYMKDEIRHIARSNTSVDLVSKENIDVYSKWFLCIVQIMSKCKYIICDSGNCSLWMMFFRGNCHDVIQHLHKDWFKLP